MMNQGQSCGAAGQQNEHQKQDGEIRTRLSHIKNKILVMSGKGGVGKSSVAAYLSVALAKRGYKVGLMDVDLHGPSIPRLLGLRGTIRPGTQEAKAKPIEYLPNLAVMSIEPLMGEDKDQATIWRGPLKIGVIRQFIADIEWDDLDYLIVDSPPGTGDEPLTVAQTIPDAEALIVTTPQEISLADVRKSIHFCRQVNMKILGLLENMSGLTCPHCGKVVDLFKTGGGMITAKQEQVELLGSLPLEPKVVQNGDTGTMALLDSGDAPFAQAFFAIVDKIIEMHKDKVNFPMTGSASGISSSKKENGDQKTIVIPVADGKLSPHFGHSEAFAFIEAEKGKIIGSEMKTPPPHEPGVLPSWLYEQGADVVISSGMGEQAQQMLREKGVEVILGAPLDSPESIANQFLSGSLVTGNNACDH